MENEENFVISQTKLFVGWLDWSIRGKDLNDEFSKFGKVVYARVNLDPMNKNRSKGFGFVIFENPEDAQKAQAEMNEKDLRGRQIRVDFAKENPEKLQKAQEARAARLAAEEVEEVQF